MNVFRMSRLLNVGRVAPQVYGVQLTRNVNVCSNLIQQVSLQHSRTGVLDHNSIWQRNRWDRCQQSSVHQSFTIQQRFQCTKKPENTPEEKQEEAKLSVFARFKKAYREHGKVMVGVHIVTSTVWFGSFFYIVHTGFDIIPILEYIGLSETLISPFRNSSAGEAAVAYLMYKLATPARYTVTLAGTNYVIKHRRKTGKMPKQEEKFRDLVKDGQKDVTAKLKEKRKDISAINKQITEFPIQKSKEPTKSAHKTANVDKNGHSSTKGQNSKNGSH